MAVGDRYLGEKQNTVAVSAVATLPTIAANGLFTAIALLHARRCTCMRARVCVCVCVGGWVGGWVGCRDHQF